MLACAAGLVGVAGCGTTDPYSRAAPPTPRGSSSTPRPSPTPRPSRGRARAPVHLAIPSLGVATPLIRLGLNEDRTVEVPDAPELAGWFGLGTVPGQRGSSVILGHVDSVDGPAVFSGLSTIRVSDRVEVLLSDDELVTFEVTDVETFANADFPAERVYAGTRRVAALNLVTCGGDYDPERGGYQANVVVFTRRVWPPGLTPGAAATSSRSRSPRSARRARAAR